MISSLQELFDRDLDRLAQEILLYKNESTIWLTEGDVNNSAGSLCLHLCGNLQHFIGAVIGDSGYQRDREREFNHETNRDELLAEINRAKSAVREGFEQLTPEKLSGNFPIEVFKRPMTTEFFVIHLHGHLNYHLGQISYHRRLLDK